MRRTILIALVLTSGTIGAAQAQERSSRPDPWGDATVSRAAVEAKAGQQFDTLDINHDGSLSAEELAAMMPAGGPGGGSIARFADSNGDGKVDKAEFVAIAMRRFDMADTDHNGQLTKSERDTAREAMRSHFRNRPEGGGMGGSGMGGAMNGDGGMGGGGGMNGSGMGGGSDNDGPPNSDGEGR